MGQIKLIAPSRERLPAGVEDRVYMTGLEGIPWQCRNSWENDQLIVQRSVSESGYCSIPWLRADGREVILTTSTLREQAEPYLLELELARGAVNRLRNQAAAWDIAPHMAPDEVRLPWQLASSRFVDAATTHRRDPAAAANMAAEALHAALESQQALVALHSQQALKLRLQASPRLNTLFACRLDRQSSYVIEAAHFLPAFNASSVDCTWKEVEANENQFDFSHIEATADWCAANRLRVCSGPLISFDQESLPNWIYLWDDDFEALTSYVSRYVTQTVSRLKGRVHVWEAAGRINLPGALNLNEDHQLHLVVTAIQAVRKTDPQAPLVVGLAHPWSEYLARNRWEIAPLHVADALLRAEVGVAGFSLEIPLGYQALGGCSRDLLDISQMIDRWGQLGAPLLIRLAIASDPGAGIAEGFHPSEQRQSELAQEVMELLLGKPSVHGIIYQCWNDRPAGPYSHGGLVTDNGRPKPALETVTRIRQTTLH